MRPLSGACRAIRRLQRSSYGWNHSHAYSRSSLRRCIASVAYDGDRMVLTDAMALLYRSHFAFSHDHRLRTSGNRDTTVEFGFLSTVLSLLELSPHPTHFAVVFDASGKTFRHELYTGYKGQRPPAPEEIVAAVPVVQDLLRAMNITEIRVPGVEADDIIGTLARRAIEEEGMAVAVASPDKDFFQLLRPGLILLRPPKKNREDVNRYSLVPYSEDDFAVEWDGLRPDQFVDVLSLMGDSSDNVPGVPGIGPKMAIKLMHQFGSLEEVLRRPDEAQPKRAATALATEDALAAARLSKQLVELRTDVDVPSTNMPLDSMRLRVPADGGRAAFEMLADLEFESHARRLKSLWGM